MRSSIEVYKLIQTIKLLSLPSRDQYLCLPDFVDVPDEMALLFSDQYRQVKESTGNCIFNQSVDAELEVIDKIFDYISGNAYFFSAAALDSTDEWNEIRQRSSNILKMIAEPPTMPDLYWVHFVDGAE